MVAWHAAILMLCYTPCPLPASYGIGLTLVRFLSASYFSLAIQFPAAPQFRHDPVQLMQCNARSCALHDLHVGHRIGTAWLSFVPCHYFTRKEYQVAKYSRCIG
ncbi:hypothetical protein F5B21DRAFT_462925 [Xylaria acuta]|nr:hypothetical protein F5B21DRAFT_462925 [Xylaria acuta]